MDIDFIAVHCSSNISCQQCGTDIQVVLQYQTNEAI
jgi:hypothetical protein